jgi:hypothetical protein
MTNTARTTRKSYAPVIGDRSLANDGFIHVSIMNYGRVHTHHCGVVSKATTTPLAAHEADAHVAETIVHAAVVADMGAPITVVENIVPAIITPVRGRPKKSRLRSGNPRARYPVVVSIPGPIAGRPKVAILRA